MLKDYGNWCPDVYRNLFVDRHNDHSIRISPCCASLTTVEPINTFSFKNNLHLTKLRNQFKNNERPPECQACWTAEDAGHQSRRQLQIEGNPAIDKIDYDVVLTGLDHSATWACNLACVMCGPINSSTWAKELALTNQELIQLGRHLQKTNNFVEVLDLSNITKVYFNGGEPLLNNEHLTLLKILDEKNLLKNVGLSYTSNGTISPSQQARDLWNKAQSVQIYFSIDATERAFNYIRWPSNWDMVSNNIVELINFSNNLSIGINATVGNYNVLEVIDVYNWFNKILPDSTRLFHWQFVNQLNYQLEHLPMVVKHKVIEELKDIEKLKGIVNYINSTIDTPSTKLWTHDFDQIDKRRGTDWRESLKIGKYY